jgi:hypothetical protein
VLDPLPLGLMPELRATVEGSAGGFPLQIGQLAHAVFRLLKFIVSEFEGVKRDANVGLPLPLKGGRCRAGVNDFNFVQNLTATQRLRHEHLGQLFEVKEGHAPAQHECPVGLLTAHRPQRGIRRLLQNLFRANSHRWRWVGTDWQGIGNGSHGDDPFG